MNKLFYFVLMTLIAPLIVTSCVNSSRDAERPINTEWHDLTPGTLVADSLRQSGDTVGYVLGNFTGKGIDTLYCIAIGSHWYADPDMITEFDVYDNHLDTYRFSNYRTQINDMYITDHPWLNFIKVDDLDSDGRDEMQFLHNGATSTWLSYQAYDYCDNEWVLLTRPVTFCTMAREDNDTIRVFINSFMPDSLLVYEDEFLPEADPGEVVTVTKFILIERQPIQHKYDTCFSLPGGHPIPLSTALSH